MKKITLLLSLLLAISVVPSISAPQPATEHTKVFQRQLRATLPFADTRDFALADKGLLKRPERLEIKNRKGDVVWELGGYDFLQQGKDYDSIHPSLQRQATLNMKYGLYQVTDGIYQVRGYDLANMTFIKGKTGWIIFDVLTVPETARAALELVKQELGDYPVKAVIYSHAHADHFGGIRGVVSQQQVDSGEVEIIAPRGFAENAVKENVLAGNAMPRRTTYQYGNTLSKGPTGQVDAAIGKGVAKGIVGFIPPTREIAGDLETIEVDGIQMVMQNTPGTEAPAEMNTYLPQFKALWMAENVIGAFHNIYTLRGALTRDALAWSKYINVARHTLAKDAEVMFASHSWPRWGNAELIKVLENQRDMYGYIHDRALYLANQGVTINEIHNELNVPEELSQQWYNRGYHGSYSHNVRAVVNRYLGYFDMVPATLNKLSPVDSAPKYVAYMGGAEKLLSMAKKAFADGEYRWVAEVVNHLVFAEPDNPAAKELLAATYEQLGYQSESAGWRNTYLQGAWELRNGVASGTGATTVGPDVIASIETGLLLDYFGVRLNAEEAKGLDFAINLNFPDRDEKFLVELKNSHLNNIAGIQSESADLTVTMNRSDLMLLLMKQVAFKDLMESGKLRMEGQGVLFGQLLSMLDQFEFWFNIVTP